MGMPSLSKPAGSEIAAAPRKLAGRSSLPSPTWRPSSASSACAPWSPAGLSRASRRGMALANAAMSAWRRRSLVGQHHRVVVRHARKRQRGGRVPGGGGEAGLLQARLRLMPDLQPGFGQRRGPGLGGQHGDCAWPARGRVAQRGEAGGG
ncbi:hypothetical protein G6F57_019110 [Rhizopus arrhizus]|nr:hypothetical protein G6F57_019110 [Rhizopus arrhizus]